MSRPARSARSLGEPHPVRDVEAVVGPGEGLGLGVRLVPLHPPVHADLRTAQTTSRSHTALPGTTTPSRGPVKPPPLPCTGPPVRPEGCLRSGTSPAFPRRSHRYLGPGLKGRGHALRHREKTPKNPDTIQKPVFIF